MMNYFLFGVFIVVMTCLESNQSSVASRTPVSFSVGIYKSVKQRKNSSVNQKTRILLLVLALNKEIFESRLLAYKPGPSMEGEEIGSGKKARTR